MKARAQRRTLFWGILSAIVLRGLMIVAGTELVERFHWVLYLFGAFLLYTAYGLLTSGDEDAVQPEKNRVLKLVRRLVPMSPDYDGELSKVVMRALSLSAPPGLEQGPAQIEEWDSLGALSILLAEPVICGQRRVEIARRRQPR